MKRKINGISVCLTCVAESAPEDMACFLNQGVPISRFASLDALVKMYLNRFHFCNVLAVGTSYFHQSQIGLEPNMSGQKPRANGPNVWADL